MKKGRLEKNLGAENKMALPLQFVEKKFVIGRFEITIPFRDVCGCGDLVDGKKEKHSLWDRFAS